jgi:hypothetical protein
MITCPVRWLIAIAVVVTFQVFVVGYSRATGPDSLESGYLDLFDAMDRGLAEVTVIPRDAKRLTLQIKNVTQEPLQLRVPSALAAAPVLAQFQLPGQIQLPGQPLVDPANARNQLPQVLGVGGPVNGNINVNPNRFPGALFNVPPGKVLRQRLACVCLEHGRPDPNPRHAYQIKRLSDVTEHEAELRAVLEGLGQPRYSQRVAQIAAWHLCNELDWPELAELTGRLANGQRYRQFTRSELALAARLVDQTGKDEEAPRRDNATFDAGQ